MSAVAEVKLWGRTIGAVALRDGEDIASFEYDHAFARSGIEIAPLTMPLATRIYRFPELSPETFRGLPGLLSDSLPDKFGNALIDAWLAALGRTAESFNVVERLCYTGTRGMGALEYSPVIGPRLTTSDARIHVERLVQLASEILTNRNDLQASFKGREREQGLRTILRVGTSAGGARAKAVIAWNPETNEVRSGQARAEKGFDYWLLKFDGVRNNADKEPADPKGYGTIEYAYYRMARDAGLSMSECRLLKEGGRQHFMTRRFDRTANGSKLHLLSLGAIAHFDFNLAGGYSYEQAMQVMQRLNLKMAAIEQQFRRMAFNIIARNQDDHVKNIAFLMDQSGTWSLSPAYDVTWSHQPHGRWTSVHQMTLNGKRTDFTLDDFEACAGVVSMKRGLAKTIIRETVQIVSKWCDYADDAGVLSAHRDQISAGHRLRW